MPFKLTIQQFRTNRKGTARFLGTLEARLMELIWKRETMTVQDACDRLGKGANYKTVMTVLNRLVEKELLSRAKVSRAFVYSARVSREEFVRAASHQIVTGLVND